MCGIICGISNDNIIDKVLSGLTRLEYRGYDSAGISTIFNNELVTRKAVGKVAQLIEKNADLKGKIAISHTRWATHGPASKANAHPHSHEDSAWVHNGIINNHSKLRNSLKAKGYEFTSETDSEVLGILFNNLSQKNNDPMKTLKACYDLLEGSFAWVLINKKFPDQILFATKQSPLVLGTSTDAVFLSSDPLALIDYCNNFYCLPSGSIGVCSLDQKIVLNATSLQPIELNKQAISFNNKPKSEKIYKHYMLQEIHEQPTTIKRCIEHFWHNDAPSENLELALEKIPENIKFLQFVGCGSSHYAAMIGKYWLTTWSQWLISCDIASEFKNLLPNLVCPSMLIALSQSGETADTLAAFCNPKTDEYISKATICNVLHSSLARISDIMLPILAGQEVGVASTKAFSNQLIILLLFALSQTNKHQLWSKVKELPKLIEQVLELEQDIKEIANKLSHEQKMLFLGRGIMYPVALEGALKLKELSYIHAHAYPAGELKHGPLALVDDNLVTIALLNNNNQREKTIANLREIQARHGRLALFYEGKSQDLKHLKLEHAIKIPSIDPMFSPIAFTVALQLFAYHIANQLGLDVDQPRNLAKSVTVE